MTWKRRVSGLMRGNTPEEECSTTGSFCAKPKRRSQNKEEALKEQLASSKRAHHAGYECEVCFLTFYSVYTLRRHLKRYRNPKYPCDECGIKFSNAEILQTHIRYTHEVVISKKYKLTCPVCNQKTNLEPNLQSHLCHYHSGWTDAHLNVFASISCPDETGTLFASDNTEISQTAVTKKLRKQNLIRLIKYLVRTMPMDNTETTLADGKNTKLESFDKNLQPFVEIHRMPNVVREEETKKISFSGLKNSEESKEFRDARSTKYNPQKSLRDGSESDSNEVTEASNDIRKKSWRGLSKEGWTDESYRYAALRILYSCKDCYVPLPRIDSTKKTPIEVVTRKIASKGSTVKGHMKTPLERPTAYQSDDSEICREMREPLEQLQNKRWEQQEREKRNQFELIDVEMRLENVLNSDVFIKSEMDDRESYESSSVFAVEALDESSDPLGFSCKSEVDNCNVDESPTETSDTFARYSVPLNFSQNTEFVNRDDGDISGVRAESFAQCQESPKLPFKVEPMDCNVDEDSVVRTESFAQYPELLNFPITTKTVNYGFGVPSNEFTNVSAECTDTFDASVKIEIEDHAICESSDYSTESAAERPGILNTNTSWREIGALSESSDKTQGQQVRTMISSKICDELFTTRRAMLRHCRERHLTCFNDCVYCTCGKEMIGRRAMENHFSRHCDRVIETTELTTDPSRPCKPLEKKYVCTKCGEKFWLETCLYDHPPHCEAPKVKTVKQNRVTKNPDKTYGMPNYLSVNADNICRVCDVKFTSSEALLRHVRAFSTNERHPCPICRTEFPGVRLLKGHVQSTHEVNSTTLYTFFCDICNQGSTKRLYKRIHMMHIHANEVRKSTGGTTENYHSATDGFVPVVMNTPENQCDVCNLVFVNRKRFMDHISYYNRNELFRCNICGEAFEGQYRAHHHRKKVHYGGNMQNAYTHYCAICKEGFMYKTHLHAHMFHVHDKEFNCVTSMMDYTSEEQNGMVNSADEEFACNQCSKKFPTDSILLAHLDSYHSGDAMPGRVKCSQCDEEFSTWSRGVLHLKHSHATDPNDPPDLRFVNNLSSSTEFGNIDNSISSRMLGGPGNPNAGTPQPRGTDETNPEKSESGNISLGRKSHGVVSGDKSSTTCTTCGFDCPGAWGLAKHRAMYLNTGIYECEFCGRRFNWQSFYRDHKLKHFRRDVHNNCFCPVCDEGFETAQSLQMHTIHLHQQSLDKLVLDPRRDSSHKLLGSTPENIAESKGYSSESKIWKNEATDSNETCDSHRPHAKTLGDDKLLRKCRNRGQKYKTYELLQEDPMSLEDSSNSLNDCVTCNVCGMICINKQALKIHRVNCHPLNGGKNSTTRGSECLANRQGNVTVDRFYVSLGDNIHPQAVDSIGRKINECNKAVGLTNNLYRYEASLKCKVCNLTFIDEVTLNTHHEDMHKSRFNFQFVSANVDQKHDDEISSDRTRSHGDTRSHMEFRSEAEGAQTLEDVSIKIAGRTCAESIPKMSRTTFHNQSNYHQCKVCDITFIDKNLLAVHEENVHCLETSDGDPSNEGSPQSLNSATVASQPPIHELPLETENESLPTTQLVTQHSQSVFDLEPVSAPMSPEEICISDDETEDSSELSSTAKNSSFRANKRKTSPHRIRLVNLPPGNYKIAKLKVRSVDTAVGKLMKNMKSTENRMKY